MSKSTEFVHPYYNSLYPPEKLVEHLRLHVLTDREWSRGRDMLTVAKEALRGRATVIQLRDKHASARMLIEEGLALRAVTREWGALLIVNDRIDIALAIDADGAHVGQEDVPASSARQLLGPQRILGVSIANEFEAREAVAAGADYLGVSPIFPTQSKADTGPAIGLHLLTELAHRCPVPLVAIGGITIGNASEVVRAGASGVAVISAVVSADDIADAAFQLRIVIDNAI